MSHTAHDGGHRTRHTGDDRYALIQADVESSALIDLIGIGSFVEESVTEKHEHSTHDEHHSHNLHTVKQPVEQSRLLCQQTYDHGRQHAYKQQPVEAVFVFQTRKGAASLGCRRMVKLEELLPIEAYDGEDSAKLDDESECMDERIALFDAQKVLGDDHVACRRHGQKLREALDDGNDHCL